MEQINFKEQAFKKLDEEYKKAKLSQKGKAVSGDVLFRLKKFCEQENEFAQAIVQTDKTISDCIAYTVKGCGSSISDFEVYAKAAEFYFPGAKVHMTLALDLVGDAAAPELTVTEGGAAGTEAKKKKSLEFSFDDLFGGGDL
jgi:hypothetical protein